MTASHRLLVPASLIVVALAVAAPAAAKPTYTVTLSGTVQEHVHASTTDRGDGETCDGSVTHTSEASYTVPLKGRVSNVHLGRAGLGEDIHVKYSNPQVSWSRTASGGFTPRPGYTVDDCPGDSSTEGSSGTCGPGGTTTFGVHFALKTMAGAVQFFNHDDDSANFRNADNDRDSGCAADSFDGNGFRRRVPARTKLKVKAIRALKRGHSLTRKGAPSGSLTDAYQGVPDARTITVGGSYKIVVKRTR